MKTAKGYIYGINGPVVYVKGSNDFAMLQMVKVGNEGLIGEVIGVDSNRTVVQVYESTTGLRPNEPVESLGIPMSVTLAPGIIGNIFDGIERPLKILENKSGAFLDRGIDTSAVDLDKKWKVSILAKVGDTVQGGDIIATTQETPLIQHKIMIPPDCKGTVVECAENGSYTAKDVLLKLELSDGSVRKITMLQKWPIRTPRPTRERKPLSRPLITGQRIIDTMLPIAKGGTAAIPGGFGTGKTMTQHQLAKWCDADLIVYIGCGERGNEMTQVLEDFSKLVDPKSGRSLMERTVLIANTSNMPVAAREASIYTGIALAEYYRDMGYHVAIMADSTSRWAEALREISGRLEEMPAEEGFPAYLSSRLAAFYERAGYVETLNGSEGSVTIIGAVSPQGGDFSEPVTQNTKRFVRCFWALDRQLAYARHYPAINWLTSYSEYANDFTQWYDENLGEDFVKYRAEISKILQEESRLSEIVKLIGSDVLHDEQKLVLEIAKIIRQGFLQQNAYHKSDTYVPPEKQMKMMEIILYLQEKAKDIIARKIPISQLRETNIIEDTIKLKYEIGNDELQKFDDFRKKIDSLCEQIIQNQQ